MITINVSDCLNRENLAAVKETILNDGILFYPTDTLYGMGGNPFSDRVIDRIDSLKGRRDQPYSIAVSDPEMLKKMVTDIPEIFQTELASLLPGKFTFLFKPSADIPSTLLKGHDRIGIRIPDFPPLLAVIRFLQIPVISTSVNISGRPPLRSSGDISGFADAAAKQNIRCILIDAGDLPRSNGSTIVDTVADPVRIIRKGDDFHKLTDLNILLR